MISTSSELVRRTLRATLPVEWFLGLGAAYNSTMSRVVLGREQYARLKALDSDRANVTGDIELRVPGLLHPIALRPRTTDSVEFVHTIIRRTYDVYLPNEPVRLIVDAGANFGDSTTWYLSKFRNATVIAVEPDPLNFAALQRNCRPYGDRVVLMRAGLWPSDVALEVRNLNGQSDVFVEEASPGGPSDCPGVSPQTLLKTNGDQLIDIFKCDIEGAEARLFGGGDLSWLARVRSLYVDVHSGDARRIVERAAGMHGFSCRRYRELCVLTRQ